MIQYGKGQVPPLTLDLSNESAVVLGAVSDKLVEITSTDQKLARNKLASFFTEATVVQDSAVIISDPALVSAIEYARELVEYPCCGEELKSISVAEDLCERLRTTKPKNLVVIGSGSLVNLVTYAYAKTELAGKLCIVPTNAMSIADVAYGGLGLINGATKNAIRCNKDPDLILLSRKIFESAPLQQQVEGQIEVVKHLLFQDGGDNGALLRALLTAKSIGTDLDFFKSATVGLHLNILVRYAIRSGSQCARNILNFGHSHAHVLELLSSYQISHGEAVRFGMAVESAQTRPDIASNLVRDVEWSLELVSATRELVNLCDSEMLRLYQEKYLRESCILTLHPNVKEFPYPIGASYISSAPIRETIERMMN